MGTRTIYLKPGEMQDSRARPLAGQIKTRLLPPLIIDPGDVVVYRHEADRPVPPPPDPEPEPDRDYIVTEALSLQAQSKNDYMGIKWPTPDGNVLYSIGSHELHTDGSRHEHGFNYGRKPGASNGRLSFHDINWSWRFGSSKPPPYWRVEETEWLLTGDSGIIMRNARGTWRLALQGGALQWQLQ